MITAERTLANDRRFSFELLDRFSRPLPTLSPAEWGEQNVEFDDPEVKGRFTLLNREYLREPINQINNDDTHDLTLCFATGMAKTVGIMVMMAWKIEHEPFRGLWVMPSTEGAGGTRSFSTTRLQPMVRKTATLAKMIPSGADRHKFKALQLTLGGTVLDFVGANSPGQLSSNRCSLVIQDEKDKFRPQLNKEAGAGYLANERTKNVPHAKRIGTSTPTIETGLIWQDLMASDLRRRFLPCPHCNPSARRDATLKGWFVLVNSKQFTVLPTRLPGGVEIPLAEMHWDDESKRVGGDWDMDRVINSTRFECPHCGGHLRDPQRTWMDKNGVWIPTQIGSPHHVGYHLPAFYAAWRDFDSSWGGMAKKFLDAQANAEGMRGIINSDFAEVDASQEHGMVDVAVNTKPDSQPDWVAQLTADFQKNWPYLWFVVRKWCAFKMLPPFKFIGDKPEFSAALDLPENVEAKQMCDALLAGKVEAWKPVAELMRFDSRTGRSPVIDFLIGKGIVGEKLLAMFNQAPESSKFREVIYLEMTGSRPPRGGDSELVAAGHLALSGDYVWDELAQVCVQFEIGKGMPNPNRCVGVDCGYQEKFNREVLRKCAEVATEWKYYDPMNKTRPPVFFQHPRHQFCLKAPRDGWLPMKGYPMNQRWNHGGIRNELNMNIEDPFFGTPNAGEMVVEVLEFPSGLFWLRKDDLRKGRGHAFNISPNISLYPKVHSPGGEATAKSSFKLDDYARQMNEQFYDERKGSVEPRHGKGGSQGRRHPFHLDDCETMQIALATHNEFFDEKGKQ